MKNAFLYNSEIQKLLKQYSEKRIKYKLKNINKEPYEIMEEIKK